jgi:hypothetical protein
MRSARDLLNPSIYWGGQMDLNGGEHSSDDVGINSSEIDYFLSESKRISEMDDGRDKKDDQAKFDANPAFIRIKALQTVMGEIETGGTLILGGCNSGFLDLIEKISLLNPNIDVVGSTNYEAGIRSFTVSKGGKI